MSLREPADGALNLETASAEDALRAGGGTDIGKSPGRLFWERFRQDRLAFVGLAFIALLVILALTAPLISKWVGHGPNELFQREMTDEFGLPKGPRMEERFFFGGDTLGRDLFVRVLYGARTSLLIAIVATGISTVIGVVLGLLAGFFGGKIDTFVSRMIDVVLSMPLLLFAIGLGAACTTQKEGCFIGISPGGTRIGLAIRPGLTLVVFIIALFSWPYIARIVRGNTLSLREKEFVEASRSLGATNRRIMFGEILPNLWAPIIVYATLIIPSNVIFEASLAFLGVGVPQTTPSWGRQLQEAASIFEIAPWMMIFPGIFLLFTTLSFNLLGDGLRDALDPRTAK